MLNGIAETMVSHRTLSACHLGLVTAGITLTLLLAAPAYSQSDSGIKSWPFCPVTTDVPLRPVIPETLETNDLFLMADQAESIEGGMSTAIGDAELAYNQQQLTADRIDYHQPTDVVNLKGNVNYWDDDVYLNSIDGYVELETEMPTSMK